MLKKVIISYFLFITLFLFAGSAMANSLTIVASETQLADMKPLLIDLEDNEIEVKIVDPANIKQALDDTYLFVLTSPDNPNYTIISEQLTPTVQKQISTTGGQKMILLRDTWKSGQEVLVFAGNSEADISNIRKNNQSTWWDIMSNWYDIVTGSQGGY